MPRHRWGPVTWSDPAPWPRGSWRAAGGRRWRPATSPRGWPTAWPGPGSRSFTFGESTEDEPAEIGAAIGGEAALVVGDHYGLGADWFAGMRREVPGAALMAIDDLADRPLPVDLVLNQNLGASADAYASLVPPGARILAGPAYALLRPEFALARARGRTRDGTVERILVFISGADAPDVTSRAVTALEGIGGRSMSSSGPPTRTSPGCGRSWPASRGPGSTSTPRRWRT